MKHNILRRAALLLLVVTLLGGMLISCDIMLDGGDADTTDADTNAPAAPTDMAGIKAEINSLKVRTDIPPRRGYLHDPGRRPRR